MPRPILKTPQKAQTNSSILCAASTNRHRSQEQQKADKMKLDRLLRQPRSKEYMEAMHKLDAGGHPYEVHTLDFTNGIIEHYQEGQTLPDGLEKARGIAMRGGYAFIEVYADCCRAVSANGTVSVIPC